jgi:hypothetical protein
MIPNLLVIRISKTFLLDVPRWMARLNQGCGQRGGQIRVDQKQHDYAACNTE